MQHRTKLLMSALIAALALSAAVSTAHARRFQLSNQRFLAIWEEAQKLTFEAAGIFNVACKVTIEGSFHSVTLSKVSGQLVGYITSAATTRPCNGGEAWVQNGTEEIPGQGRVSSLPWHIRYDSFRGTLPRINGIRLQLIGAGFLISVPGVGSCLALTSATKPAMGIVEVNETTGVVESLRPEESTFIPTTRLSGLCAEGAFVGRGRVFLQGEPGLETTKIIVRLVQ
jgi:hypothetical protein